MDHTERLKAMDAEGVELHELAKELALTATDFDNPLSKPNRRVIAIARHDQDSDLWADSPHHRFLWIRGRERHTVKKIHDAYVEVYSKSEDASYDPDLKITLSIGGMLPPLSTTMKELDFHEDRHIVFKAIRMEASPNASLSAMPPDQLSSHSPSRRLPLQPINRQLSVPPENGLTEQAHERLVKHTALPQSPTYPENRSPPSILDPDEEQSTHPSISPVPTSAVGIYTEEKRGNAELPYSTKAACKVESPGSLTPTPSSERPDLIKDEPSPSEPRVKVEGHSTQEASTFANAKMASQDDYEPRPLENPFADSQQDEEPPIRGLKLLQLTKGSVPKKLEAAVRCGVKLLAKLKPSLQELPNSEDAQAWLEQIEAVRKQAVKTRTVVGVVGNTGAGKSSVINAMLEEERLVPTNCMRACTAVVTEMSYNESKNEAQKYRAEIEFIKPEDWKRELRVLFDEVFDSDGNMSREATNPDTQAGVAYAKIRSVYHKFTNEMLKTTTVDNLMQVKTVQSVLGTTKRINERTCEAFYKRLQFYVDSKEKIELDKNGNKKTNPKRDFEYWPLIKLVRIYTKAEALSTGAVIVDLPGVHDQNAARAAVAEGYMKQCTGLWIVAPINRAVDDKAAKNLLGSTFKRQLKYDGTYSAVTFICSKTDDISRTEATDSLKLGSRMTDLEDHMDGVLQRKRELTKQMKEAVDTKDDHASAIDDIDTQLEIWEGLHEKSEQGKTVYAPSAATKKRKNASRSPKSRAKKCIRIESDDDDDFIDDGSESEPEEAEEEEDENAKIDRMPLTSEEIENKVEELKQLKKDARKEKSKLNEKVQDFRKQIRQVKEEEAEIDAKQSQICIEGRNEYSRGAIRADFAAGIRELDQENAAEEDPDNFNPEEDIRDYEEVGRSLPVFCVSSRAYQKLAGRLKKDKGVPGFTAPEQTEIPLLQTHCKKLTEGGRQAACRQFLNSLMQLLTSMGLWASDDGNGLKLTSQQRDTEKGFLTRRLKELEVGLEKTVAATMADAKETLAEQVFDQLGPAREAATKGALPTANGWGAHRDMGGLYWATYKATVRRNGVYAGASGSRDFNAELTEPLYKVLASTWEKAFQRRLPHILQSFTKSAANLLKKFHAAVEARSRERGHGIARMGMLANQLNAYTAIFGDLATAMIGAINEAQREINREFTPVIAAAMEPAYDYCTNERGTGSYKRMKAGMAQHVSEQQVHMFETATRQVKSSLKTMCVDITTTMLDRADKVYVSMRKDYMTIIGGVNADQTVMIPRHERAVRRTVDEIITKSDELFEEVIKSAVEDLNDDDFQDDAKEEGEGQEMDTDDEQVESDCDSDEDREDEGEVEAASEGTHATDCEDADVQSAEHAAIAEAVDVQNAGVGADEEAVDIP